MGAIVKHIRSPFEQSVSSAIGLRGESGLPIGGLLAHYVGGVDTVGESGELYLVDSAGRTTATPQKGQSWRWDGSAYVDNIQGIADALGTRGGTIEIGHIRTADITAQGNVRLFGGIDGGGSIRTYRSASAWTGSVAGVTGFSFNIPYNTLLLNVESVLSFTVNNDTVNTAWSISLNGVVQGSGSVAQPSLAITSFRLGAYLTFRQESGYTTYYRIWDADGNEIAYIPCINAIDENIPALINGAPATLTAVNATFPDFYHEHQDGYGYGLNTLGYSVADGHATYADGCIFPANPNSPSQDITGNTLQYPGPIKNNALVKGHTGDWDGIAYLSTPHLVGNETIVGSTGTSAPTISAGRIDFTVGTCPEIVLSDGTHYVIENDPDSEGVDVFDVSDNGNHATLTNPTVPFFTVESEYATYLAENGWSNWGEGMSVNETFTIDDITKDPLVWKQQNDSGASLDVQDGKLVLSATSTGAADIDAQAISRFKLKGDFDVYIEGEIINTNPPSSDISHTCMMQVYSLLGGYLTCGKTHSGASGRKFSSWCGSGWTGAGFDAVNNASIFGSMITRRGSTLNTYYKTSLEGSWIPMGTYAGDTSDLILFLKARADYNATVVSHITKLIVPENVVVWPNTKIPAKSDGSLSVLDQALTAKGGELKSLDCGAKVYFPQTPGLISSDLTNILFDASGNSNDLTYPTIDGWAGDQFFHSGSLKPNQDIAAIYEADLAGDKLAKAKKYFGIS